MATVSPVLDRETAPARIEEFRRLVRRVLVASHIERYAAELVRGTAPGSASDPEIKRYVTFGASPRGGQALLFGGKVRALLEGRPHVTYEDVEAVAPAALCHRLVMSFAAETDGLSPARIIERVLASASRPRT